MSEKPSIEACICNSVEPECGVNSQNEAEALLAELAELRRKAALTDRLADEVLRHRARQIWDTSYSATSATAEKRARAGMVEEGLLP